MVNRKVPTAAAAPYASHAPLLSVKNNSTSPSPKSTSSDFLRVAKYCAPATAEANTTNAPKKLGLAWVEKMRRVKKPRHGRKSAPGKKPSTICNAPYANEIHAAIMINLVSVRISFCVNSVAINIIIPPYISKRINSSALSK